VWDIGQGACVSIFGGHVPSALSCSWSPRPQLHSLVLSGGADCALRLWRAGDHPAAAHTDTVQHFVTKRDKKKNQKEEKKAEEDKNYVGGQAHVVSADKINISKKYLLPIIYKQIANCHLQGARQMLQNYIEKNTESCNGKKEAGNNGEGDFNELTENKNSSVNNKDAFTPDKDAETPDKDAETPDKDASTPDKDAETPDKDAETPEKDAETPDKDASTPDKDA
ncbi:unnamed protein product, partial [Parnassius apollo]